MSSPVRKILQLHPGDNVVVCIQALREGEDLLLSGARVSIRDDIGIGHKLAGKTILQGSLIVKYGVPIGTATREISPGEHVHTHNIKSNYIATHLAGDSDHPAVYPVDNPVDRPGEESSQAAGPNDH
jgi:(2R)-sulfolactate sulfo-lyase subunit alpha